ncbi:MAG TPA: NAD(P)-dependent oxidoreductase [Nitrospiria bacterium]|nr:NAD(P)-dependent oxidoreductase [Nitrospiria bacterium]
MDKAKVLIIGSSGFLGQRLCETLAGDGHDLVRVGRRPPSSRLISGPYFQIDVTQREGLETLLDRIPEVQLVIYLAAATPYSPETRDDLTSLLKTNIIGPCYLLEWLDRAGQHLEGICFASSVDVYGPVTKSPVDEHCLTRPVTNYGITKLAGELLFSDYCAKRDMPMAVLRFTQIYGPADNSPKLVTAMMRDVADGKRPTIYGDGSDLRDLLFIDDAVASIKRFVETRQSGTFNVATGQSFSVLQIASQIMKQFAIDEPPRFLARQKDKVDFVFDTSRLNNDFGFRTTFDLEKGLQKTAQWLKHEHGV